MMAEEITLEAPVTGVMITLLTVLSLFTVVGSVGNGLVLFVFSRVRDKTTAQLFILALAVIDLFTCMVIIPLTMFVEYTRYDIKYDWLCKLYQFLITSKVPLSAFIMVAIAFDRYFCICHPLRKIITPWRTKVTIVSLTLFASMLGMMTSMAYGVNQVFYPYDPNIYHNIFNSSITPQSPETIKDWTKLGEDPSTKNDVTMTVELRLKGWLLRRNFTSLASRRGTQETVYIGICAPNEVLFSWDFVSVYQKCYTVLFLICLVIVGVLYGMIYRFIGMRRNKKLQQRLVLCAYVNSTHGCREGGTRSTMIHSALHDTTQLDDKYDCNNAQGLGPGGIYIGGSSTSTPTSTLAPSLALGTQLKPSNSVSFADELESGKPAGDVDDRANEEERISETKIGTYLNSGHGSNVDGNSECRNTINCSTVARNSHVPHTNKTKGEYLKNLSVGQSTSTPHPSSGDNSSRNTADSKYMKDQRKKSPSLGSSTARNKRKSFWKSSRRPQSFAEDCVCKDNECSKGFANFSSKRRASSPFKHDVPEDPGKPVVPWMEMKAIRCRRESEPYRNFTRSGEGGSDHCPGGICDLEEDILTIGSRNHYIGTFLETSIQEDCAMLDKDTLLAENGPPFQSTSDQLSSPCTSSKVSIDFGQEAPSIPIIKVTDNDVISDVSSVSNRKGFRCTYSTEQEITPTRKPILRNTSTDYNGKTVCYSHECNTAQIVTRFSETAEDRDCARSEHLGGTRIHYADEDNSIYNTSTSVETTTTASEGNVGGGGDGGDDSGGDSGGSICPRERKENEKDGFYVLKCQESPQLSSPHTALLNTCVHSLSPSCSTTNCRLLPYRSCSYEGLDLTREESSTGSAHTDVSSRRMTMDVSRRYTMESRYSAADSSTAHRSYAGRKKRWQHFRCKNASSIKGSHGRHTKTTKRKNKEGSSKSNTKSNSTTTGFADRFCSLHRGGGGVNGGGCTRRSFVSYDADRLREETRAANARTALMLFTVTLVFVVAFLPAWLMAHRLVATHLMVFYLYFTYNVANPFIYAFMNVIFKDHLRKIFRCRRRQRDLFLR